VYKVMFLSDVSIFLKSIDPLVEFELSVIHKPVSTDTHRNWIPQKLLLYGHAVV
jgi:hypothetical protein